MKALLVLLLCLSTVAIAKKSEPVWQTGTLLDQSSENRCRTSGDIYNGTGSIDSRCSTVTSYKVDAGELIYIFSRTTFLRHDRPLNVTVNTPIKFSLDGQKSYIQDEQGKSHEVRLIQKTKK
jgi:hypothetical protein